MNILLQDLNYAVRQLRKTPGFAVLVILTVALGIGANTAVFSMINGFLRPLPVASPEQIVVLAAKTKGDETGFSYRFPYPVLQDLRTHADTFSEVFAFDTQLSGISVDGKTTQFLYSAVTGDLFPALGLQPAAGRLLTRGEGESQSGELVVVLGYAYWQKHFAGSPSVVDRQIRLDGKAARIIGVAPKGFHGLYAGADMDGYTSLNATYAAQHGEFALRTMRVLTVYGRLKSGVSRAQAQGAADVLARRFEEQHPDTDKGIGIRVVPEYLARPLPLHFLADGVPVVRGFVLALAGLVLLLACMNVANLVLVRAAVRGREMAIRAALGSGRGRLIRQMLTESTLLAVLGAAAGLVLAKWGSDLMSGSIHLSTDFPIVLDFSFDWRVFLYALAGAAATGIGIGMWPAIRVSRTDASAVLHDGGRSDASGAGHPSRQRLRSLLVSAQVAGSLVLLIVAGLFVRSLQHAQRLDLGFDPDHLVNARMNPRYVGFDQPRTEAFYRELKRRVRALPGVQSATLAFSVPMGYISDADQVFIEGRPMAADEQPPAAGSNRVDEDYFETMRIPIVRGRAFRESDREGAPLAAIVNQTMAARYWPGQDPIGKRFRLWQADGPAWEIVGVAHDAKYLAVFEGGLPCFYVPVAQRYLSMRALQVRSLMPPEMVRGQIEKAIHGVEADMPVSDLQTMRDALEGGPAGFLLFRIGTIQAGAMGILGLVLAMIGVYGVVSCGAAQRTHEIGIRMALGAQPGDILRMILRQGVILVGIGVAAGLFAAAVLTRLTARWVLIQNATDPLTFAGVTVMLAAIALWACYLPARRAMRVDPLVALRHE